jgi:hypothetical protein
MKKIFKVFFLPLFILTACVDSLDDYNIDQKRASTATPETLYTAAVKSLMDIITTPNVNSNNYRLYVQHWSTTQYLEEPRYVLTSRLIPQNFWDALYRDVLADIKEAKKILEADLLINAGVKKNQMAQLGIIEAYTWIALVNTFGDVPYTQALDPDLPLPAYDDAETVYLESLELLDNSVAALDPAFAGFGTGEIFYASKAAATRIPAWIKLGNSLKLKLAMYLVDNPDTKAVAEAAVAEAAVNVFTSNTDNARFPYISTPPNNNPVSANLNLSLQSRRDFVGAKPFIDYLQDSVGYTADPSDTEIDDPRTKFFFNPKTNGGGYVGGAYGYTNNPVADYSEISDKVKATTFEALLIDYSEVAFLLAEAIERGIVTTGSAEEQYNNAIEASILYWGGTQGEVDTYLLQPNVAYSTAKGNWKRKIGMQKWIALYNRGWDAWNEWKRLDYPTLVTPNNATPPPNQTAPPQDLQIPVRMIYPINEQTLNGSNRAAAAAKIGGDEATTKLFWDVD